MAFKQTLIHRMFTLCNTKFFDHTLRNCRISPSSAAAAATKALTPPNRDGVAPDPGDDSVFRRFIRRSSMHVASSGMPEILRPGGVSMLEKLKEMDITRGRIRLDVLSPPVDRSPEKLTVADAKKILRVSQIEKVKAKLSSSCKAHVSYDEFVEICVEGCSNRDLGLDLAKALDESGSVIVLGDVVFLKPDQGRM